MILDQGGLRNTALRQGPDFGALVTTQPHPCASSWMFRGQLQMGYGSL